MGVTTQQFLPASDVRDDVVLLKDGSVSMVIQTSAVNFDLLSQNEQMAIIGSFAGLLNSLSFSIQIVIRSKRLDISKYLNILKIAEAKQHNPLLQLMMQRYRQFVNNIIRENEVLDKQFYVVISVSPLELGMSKGSQHNLQKAITILVPRRDHIMRQLGRIGLKASQLNTKKLLRLYYDIYNEESNGGPNQQQAGQAQANPEGTQQAAAPNQPAAPGMPPTIQPTPAPQPLVAPPPTGPQPLPNPYATLQQAAASNAAYAGNRPQSIAPQVVPQTLAPAMQSPYQGKQASKSAPFVVEELPDDYGTV